MARAFRCQMCDKEIPEAGFCVACAQELERPINLGPEFPRRYFDIPPPRVGVHVAGAPAGLVQSCRECGDVLKLFVVEGHPTTLPGGQFYPEGSLVERGPGWQAMKLSPGGPTCKSA